MNWDRNLPSASRFTILPEFNNEAVLDNNTGLVWEKSPQGLSSSWDQARFTCINKTVGGQKGWRLPSVAELASLIDPSVGSPGPTLPPGHPFLNVQESYWSATTVASDAIPTIAWAVAFVNGNVLTASKQDDVAHAWCVRGGMNADRY